MRFFLEALRGAPYYIEPEQDARPKRHGLVVAIIGAPFSTGLTCANLIAGGDIIWVDAPEQPLADPVRLMAYAMTYALPEDMRFIRHYVSGNDFRDALDHAPPEIIDPRSWAYWNPKMDRYPPPPAPGRFAVHVNSAQPIPIRAKL